MLDAIVVGAGQAGLAASYYLKQFRLEHVVFERARIGESWRSQRWDSFCLNTPSWCSHLPGDDYAGDRPDSFYHRDEFVACLDRYADRFELPIESGVEVERVAPKASHFQVSIRRDDSAEVVEARNVVIASGIQNVPKIPRVAADIPSWIVQIHSADYRNPGQLPDGAVLIVGGGQSGFQIAEDLMNAGRIVCLCSSKVGRIPRRYRGKDMLEWMHLAGIFAQRTSELEDPSVIFQPQPQVSGVGPHGRTVSYQAIAAKGALIVGRLSGYVDGSFMFDGDAADNVRYADEKSREIKTGIDQFIAATGRPTAPPEEDPNDVPDPEAACASNLRSLNAKKKRLHSLVWCTGFKGSFDWIDAPVIDDDGQPIHEGGVARVPGLYFLGFPWLRTRSSGIVSGISSDAEVVITRLMERVQT